MPIFAKRPQDQWKIRTDNSCLLINPVQKDVQNVYSFCQQYNDFLSEFVFNSIQMPSTIKLNEAPVTIDSQENLVMVIEILKEQRFIFIDVINQSRTSYKGYISRIIIATYKQLYLIDAAKLHDKCHELKEVLQKKSLIKFMHECQQVLYSLKRDFSIFMPNIFDLQVIQRYLIKKGKLKVQPKLILKQYLNSCSSYQARIRPLKASLQSQVQQYYENQMNFLLNLDKFFSTEDPEYHCYAYFNNYEFLLKSYYHHVPSVHEFDQLLCIKHGMSNNVFRHYGHHHEMKSVNEVNNSHHYWIKDRQEQQMATLICQWRQHMAKINDVNSEQIVPYATLSQLSKVNINSILQVSQACSNHSKSRVYSLSLEQFEQIFELFQLYKEQKQQQSHQLVIPRRLPYFKTNQEKPIKQLFEELKFTDSNNDWLNKKTDQAIRLYKQIVSINQFDSSIVEEYLKEINGQEGIQHLKIQEINRFIKYAEYLRNGSHNKLQELYQGHKNSKNKQKDEFFQQNFHQLQYQQKNWDQIEYEINFPTMDTIGQARSSQSLTSLQSFSNFDIQSCKTLLNPRQYSVLKQNKMNSLNQLQSPSFFHKIEPLPENIEAIYLQAARAKKSYTSKGQKKSNKANKKQSKTKIQGHQKKEEQFIPKKEQIFNLIYY